MKPILNFILILFCVGPCFAQGDESSTKQERTQALNRYKESAAFNQAHHIKRSTVIALKIKKGKNTGETRILNESSFDQVGYLTEQTYYKPSGKIEEKYKYRVEDKLFKETSSFNRKGKQNWKSINVYDKDRNIVENKFFWKSEEPYRITKSSFDSNGNTIEQKRFYKNDNQPHKTYTYLYHDDQSKKQTTEYNKKGKVTHVWNYDCKPASESNLTVSNDSSQICVRFETDAAGNKVKVKESIDGGNKIYRKIERYNSKENLVEEHFYNRKNQLLWHYINSYNENGKITEQKYFHKDKSSPNYVTKYKYDQSNLLTGTESYDRDGALHESTRIEFETYK